MVFTAVMVVLAIVVLDLVTHFRAGRTILPKFESPPPFAMELCLPDPAAESFSCRTADGIELRGSIYRAQGPARGVVVFCHEWSGDRWSALHYCGGLRGAGYDLVCFDFRNQGESGRQPEYQSLHWLTSFEVADTLAVLEYVTSQPAWQGLPVGLFGVSRGGCAALVASGKSPAVKGVICDGAYSTFGLLWYYTQRYGPVFLARPLFRLIPHWHLTLTLRLVMWWSARRRHCTYTRIEQELQNRVQPPVMLICGERDNYVTPELTRQLEASLPEGTSVVWIVPHAKHNQAKSVVPREYDQRIIDFFTTTLGPAPRAATYLAAENQSEVRLPAVYTSRTEEPVAPVTMTYREAALDSPRLPD